MKRKILALLLALMLLAGGALAELVEGQQPNWLVAKIGEDYSKVGEVSQPEGFARLEGVTPNGTEPEIYFAPEDAESPIRFFYYTTGYGAPAELAESARSTFAVYYDDCTTSELKSAHIGEKDCTFFHYTCSYPDREGETAYEQSLIGYFPITDDCFAACIISLYADGAESYAAEEELIAYLETAAAALTFEDFVTE